MAKLEWSDDAWLIYHLYAYFIASKNPGLWITFNTLFCKAIPCYTCKVDFRRILEDYVDSQDPFKNSVDIHNQVSKKIDQKEFSYEEAIRKYSQMPITELRKAVRNYGIIQRKYLKDKGVERKDINPLFDMLGDYL